jgi:hypothetical protein
MKIIAGSSNGRTPPFGGGYLGSNPSPAAMEICIAFAMTSLHY